MKKQGHIPETNEWLLVIKKKEYLGGSKCISVYALYIYSLLLTGSHKTTFTCSKKKEYLSLKINLQRWNHTIFHQWMYIRHIRFSGGFHLIFC